MSILSPSLSLSPSLGTASLHQTFLINLENNWKKSASRCKNSALPDQGHTFSDKINLEAIKEMDYAKLPGASKLSNKVCLPFNVFV